MRDLISNTKTSQLFAVVTAVDETPAAGIDLQGFFAASVAVAVGTVTNAAEGVGWQLLLEHSDDNTTFTAVEATDVIMDHGNNDGTLGASGLFATVDDTTGDDQTYTVGYLGAKRYVRAVAVAVNTPGDTPLAALVIAGSPDLAPVDD